MLLQGYIVLCQISKMMHPKGCALILFAKSLQTSRTAVAPLPSLLITPVAPIGPCRLLAKPHF